MIVTQEHIDAIEEVLYTGGEPDDVLDKLREVKRFLEDLLAQRVRNEEELAMYEMKEREQNELG